MNKYAIALLVELGVIILGIALVAGQQWWGVWLILGTFLLAIPITLGSWIRNARVARQSAKITRSSEDFMR